MLIVSDDQQRLVPGRARAHGIVSVLDQLLAKGNVVVRMLAVAGRAPVRLEKSIGRERAVGGAMLKVAEMAEVAFVGMQRVGKVVARQRVAIVAEYRPVDAVLVHQAENALGREKLRMPVLQEAERGRSR